ncbi:MAG: ATP-grasp domain-containing protein, partial [Solobacterium sp.]|nr:ATP-grasp domain-containing protein [Solobacterium sp.]
GNIVDGGAVGQGHGAFPVPGRAEDGLAHFVHPAFGQAAEVDDNQAEVLTRAHKLLYPVIVKPARTGSSVGISIAHNDEEYLESFEEARQYDEKIITEKVVKPMVEINCSVLGDAHSAKASVLEQVGHNGQLLDFEEKYMSNGKGSKTESAGMASTARIVPAPLSEAQTKLIQDLALKTFRVLGASGVCRIDFLMDTETKKVYVNEINTIPGSLAFYLWQAAGMSFSELMDALVQQAVDRDRRRARMSFSFETNLLASFNANAAKGAKGSKM